MVKIGLTRRELKLKGLELRRVSDAMSAFDALMSRCAPLAHLPPSPPPSSTLTGPSSSSAARSHPKAQLRLVEDLRAAAAVLDRSGKVLAELLPAAGAGSEDERDLRDHLALTEERLARMKSFEAALNPSALGPPPSSIANPSSMSESSPSAASDPLADAYSFLSTSTSTLAALIDRAELTVEDLISARPSGGPASPSAKQSCLAAPPDEASRNERVVRLLEWNEEREWYNDRLGKVKEMLEMGEVAPDKVLALKDVVELFLDATEEVDPDVDHTIFQQLGLDQAPPTPLSPPVRVNSEADVASSVSDETVEETKTAVSGDGGVNGGFETVAPTKTENAVRHPQSTQPATSSFMPANYRTAPCRSYWYQGWCKYGNSCTFLHIASENPADFAGRSWSEKKRPCHFFVGGFCRNGDKCNLSHDRQLLPQKALLTAVQTNPSDVAPVARQLVPAGTSSATEKPVDRVAAKRLAYKTALCPAWMAGYRCLAGVQCSFAHGEAEQRSSPKILEAMLILSNKPARPYEYAYKERLCVKERGGSRCQFGKNCVFAHGLQELRPSVAERKVTPCRWERYPEGCWVKDCLYLHGLQRTLLPAEDVVTPSPETSDAALEPLTPVSSSQSMSFDWSLDAEVESAAATSHSVAFEGATPTEPTSTDPDEGTPTAVLSPPPLDSLFLSSSTSTAVPVRATLLPLGHGTCLNHMLRGSCGNGSDCLSRHSITSADQAMGVRERLGPGACLNHFLRGRCGNGEDCLARHVLTEVDYETFPPAPSSPPRTKTPQPQIKSPVKAPVTRAEARAANIFYVSDDEDAAGQAGPHRSW